MHVHVTNVSVYFVSCFAERKKILNKWEREKYGNFAVGLNMDHKGLVILVFENNITGVLT